MARPRTKAELLSAASEQFLKMQQLIATLTAEEQEAIFAFDEGFLIKQKESHWRRDRNLRDVLIHLYEWHQLLLRWVENNQRGEKMNFLPEAYNWRTYPQMNLEFWKRHQTTATGQALELLSESHQAVMTLMENCTNEELFEKMHFSWTGTSTLGSYCISSTSSHYDWAVKKIKQHIKSCR